MKEGRSYRAHSTGGLRRPRQVETLQGLHVDDLLPRGRIMRLDTMRHVAFHQHGTQECEETNARLDAQQLRDSSADKTQTHTQASAESWL